MHRIQAYFEKNHYDILLQVYVPVNHGPQMVPAYLKPFPLVRKLFPPLQNTGTGLLLYSSGWEGTRSEAFCHDFTRYTS